MQKRLLHGFAIRRVVRGGPGRIVKQHGAIDVAVIIVFGGKDATVGCQLAVEKFFLFDYEPKRIARTTPAVSVVDGIGSISA